MTSTIAPTCGHDIVFDNFVLVGIECELSLATCHTFLRGVYLTMDHLMKMEPERTAT